MLSCAAATIVAKSSLSLARVIAQSFREHHAEILFFVLLADEVDGFFEPSREPYELIRFDELGIEAPERLRFRHAQQPLSYAAAPYLLQHLLVRGFSSVLFIKQEPRDGGFVSGLRVAAIGPLLNRYAALVRAEGHGETKNWPYAYGCFDNGIAVRTSPASCTRRAGKRRIRSGIRFRRLPRKAISGG
ncbi:MAG: hypothetical protein H7X85_06530 [Thermoanaerobaculia bacterium]|nr:hypothetical protein [Thermoanaerobaculia bacterium]